MDLAQQSTQILNNILERTNEHKLQLCQDSIDSKKGISFSSYAVVRISHERQTDSQTLNNYERCT